MDNFDHGLVIASKFIINFVALIVIFTLFLEFIDHLTIALLLALVIIYISQYANKKIHEIALN